MDTPSLVTVRTAELTSKDDWSLIWTCVSPFVLKVRGKDSLTKMSMYRHLTEHQQRLFIFTVYYNHARQSIDDFIFYSKLMLENNQWDELTKAMGFFGDANMASLLDRIARGMKEPTIAAGLDVPLHGAVAVQSSLFSNPSCIFPTRR